MQVGLQRLPGQERPGPAGFFCGDLPVEDTAGVGVESCYGPKARRAQEVFVRGYHHLNSKCEKDVYIEILEEESPSEGKCGNLIYWLYDFRPEAQAWEHLYSDKLSPRFSPRPANIDAFTISMIFISSVSHSICLFNRTPPRAYLLPSPLPPVCFQTS